MVTIKSQVAEFPAASVAIYVTVVTPKLNEVALAWLIPTNGEVPVVAPVFVHVKVVMLQLSVKVASILVAIPAQVPAMTLAVALAGHVIIGFVMSVIVTSKEQVMKFPAASFAV